MYWFHYTLSDTLSMVTLLRHDVVLRFLDHEQSVLRESFWICHAALIGVSIKVCRCMHILCLQLFAISEWFRRSKQPRSNWPDNKQTWTNSSMLCKLVWSEFWAKDQRICYIASKGYVSWRDTIHSKTSSFTAFQCPFQRLRILKGDLLGLGYRAEFGRGGHGFLLYLFTTL